MKVCRQPRRGLPLPPMKTPPFQQRSPTKTKSVKGRVLGRFQMGWVSVRRSAADESPLPLRAGDGLPVAIHLCAANVVGKDGTAHRDPTRLVPRTSGNAEGVYFAEPDCTGVAYVVSYAKDGGGTLRAHVIADREGGGTLYLGRRRETMQPLLNSVLKGSSLRNASTIRARRSFSSRWCRPAQLSTCRRSSSRHTSAGSARAAARAGVWRGAARCERGADRGGWELRSARCSSNTPWPALCMPARHRILQGSSIALGGDYAGNAWFRNRSAVGGCSLAVRCRLGGRPCARAARLHLLHVQMARRPRPARGPWTGLQLRRLDDTEPGFAGRSNLGPICVNVKNQTLEWNEARPKRKQGESVDIKVARRVFFYKPQNSAQLILPLIIWAHPQGDTDILTP
jgi:hypothetical protein